MIIDERIVDAVKGAHAITWDGCHKIYISADQQMTAHMEKIGYSMELVDSELNNATTLQNWYDSSCSLKFIQKIHSPGKNEDYENIIPQFDDYDVEEFL